MEEKDTKGREQNNKETQPVMFDRKKLLKLIIPVVIEQSLSVSVGMADSIMVSSAGEEAISGIGLVNQINVLMVMLFAALASGGSVVVAQFLGNGDKKKACIGAEQQLLACLTSSTFMMCFALLFNRQILHFVFGSVSDGIMQNAVTYFGIIVISFPFLATYNAGAALFRVMNNAHISMFLSLIMNVINVILNYVFIFHLKIGVAGVAYATLISRIVVALVLLIKLRDARLPVHINPYFRFKFNGMMMRNVLKIGIPQALENSMFQVGKLCTQNLISTFSTAAIAANTTAANIELLADIPGSAMGMALVTIVGQCVGAGQYNQARSYTRRLLKFTYGFLIVLNLIIISLSGVIPTWYHLSEDGTHYAIQLIVYHSICCMAIWPLAFSIASVLRSAGDARYTMTVSICSMWIFRIGCAYLIASNIHGFGLNLGVLGVWIAMTIDWAVRALFNIIRFSGHKWETKSLTRKTNRLQTSS